MKSFLLALSLICVTLHLNAQSYYNDVFYYFTATTPVNGVKLKTNLPFTNNSQMVTIILEGYAYNVGEPINLTFNYYIYNGAFINSKVSTSGAYNPNITLANENGKVSIFVDSKIFYQRFHIRAIAGGNGEQAAWFTGWTAVDSTLLSTATAAYTIPYLNRMSGTVTVVGNLGVGTFTPVVKLTVYGATNNEGSMSFQSNVDSRFYITEGDNMLKIGGLNQTAGVINIMNTGNVGIGTTAPGSNKLSVEGTIGARKVKVTQSDWADFVFHSDYQLPSLQEVESYIKTNKHLSGIPTTEDVRKDGVDLGEMNRLLLQKLEEMTLYMIEMKKEIELLKAAKK